MFRFILSFLLLSSVILFSSDIPKIYKNAKSAIVLILAYNGNTLISQGSGFYFTNNLIATNYHVIKGANFFTLKNIGTGEIFTTSKIKNYSKEYDLAILKVNKLSNPLSLKTSKEEIGSEVIALGNPLGLEGSISTGIISGIRPFKAYYSYQISAPISAGSSGGPVLNYQGQVIGIATFTYKNSQNLNFAMPSMLLIKLNKEDKTSVYKNESYHPKTVSPVNNWYLILGSFRKHSFAEANRFLKSLRRQNIYAYLIDTDNYKNLKNNLWAIVMGPYKKQEALKKMESIKYAVPDVYIKQRE